MGKGKDQDCTGIASFALPGVDRVLEGVRSLGLPAAYQVGGAVRDQILGKPQKDLDIAAAGLTPEELLEICLAAGKAEPLQVGEQLIGVRLWADWSGPEGIEIALLRTEHSTGSGHTDFHIQPIPVPEQLLALPVRERKGDHLWQDMILQDALRRDFTCNALFRDINGGEILDPLGGLEDLDKRQLRVVHPQSFQDDPLRMLRMLARVSRDDMSIEEETFRLARNQSSFFRVEEGPGSLSGERVQAEIIKILSGSGSSKAWGIMRELGLIGAVMPEWQECVGFSQQSRYHDLSVDDHILRALGYADRQKMDPAVKLAVLMHDIGKPGTAKLGKDGRLHYYGLKPEDPMWQEDPRRAQSHEKLGKELTVQALERLRFPKDQITQTAYLVRHHMFSEERDFTKRSTAKQELIARRMLYRHGPERSELLLQLRECDLQGKSGGPYQSGLDRDVKALRQVIQEQKANPYRLGDLAITGYRLQELGLPPGPRTGEILQAILKQVVGQPELNQSDKLDNLARRLISSS